MDLEPFVWAAAWLVFALVAVVLTEGTPSYQVMFTGLGTLLIVHSLAPLADPRGNPK